MIRRMRVVPFGLSVAVTAVLLSFKSAVRGKVVQDKDTP